MAYKTRPTINKLDRFKGCLVGLAVGDALGTTLEFKPPGIFEPIEDMVGGGPFQLKSGEWTDDTSMALCLADSLISCGGFNPVDQLERYCLWCNDGYMGSNDTCVDIGNTTHEALNRFVSTHAPFCGSTSEMSAGNGAIMRLAPIPMFYLSNPALAILMSAMSSRTTHQARASIDACRYMGGILVGALEGERNDTILSELYSPASGLYEREPLTDEIAEVAKGSFKNKEPPLIEGSGYVVRSLEAVLWAFNKTDSFKEGCLKAVNLGDDADTTGAVYGQIAGAYYGLDAIPSLWRKQDLKRFNSTPCKSTISSKYCSNISVKHQNEGKAIMASMLSN